MENVNENANKIATLKNWIAGSRCTVFFGGAGVSTESGIPDFRSENGLYSKKFDYPAEYMLSSDFYFAHMKQFYDFYRTVMLFPSAAPNKAHAALAALEKRGKLYAVITQNVDGLHTAAGSGRVYELHGSVWRNDCLKCGARYGLDVITSSEGIPRCPCGGIIKPDVVLYGEQLDDDVMGGAAEAVGKAELFIVGGTSLTVYPAAGFVSAFRSKRKGRLVIINRSPTSYDSAADLVINAAVGDTLEAASV